MLENTPDDSEKVLKDFMLESLKLSKMTVKEITFHRVHRLPSKDPKKPPPIIAKFEISTKNSSKAEDNNYKEPSLE